MTCHLLVPLNVHRVVFLSIFVLKLILLFLTHIVCQHHPWDVRPRVWSLVYLFFGSFFKVLLWFTSRKVPSILRGLIAHVQVVFIPLIMILLFSLVLSSFLAFLSNSFLIFSFISTYFIVLASNVRKYL